MAPVPSFLTPLLVHGEPQEVSPREPVSSGSSFALPKTIGRDGGGGTLSGLKPTAVLSPPQGLSLSKVGLPCPARGALAGGCWRRPSVPCSLGAGVLLAPSPPGVRGVLSGPHFSVC